MKLTPEQLSLVLDKMNRQLDIDPQTGSVKWKDPLPEPKGAWARPGQEVKEIVIRTTDFTTKRIPAKYLVWVKSRGYVPKRVVHIDPARADINAIDNLKEQ